MTTLVFILACIGNLTTYLETTDPKDFEPNYHLLGTAASMIYYIGFGVPSIIYLVWKCTGVSSMDFFHIVSIYGYSLTVFIPTLILCAIPINLLQWVLLIGASFVSS